MKQATTERKTPRKASTSTIKLDKVIGQLQKKAPPSSKLDMGGGTTCQMIYCI